MKEEWRSIKGWPYEVSRLGRVRRTVAMRHLPAFGLLAGCKNPATGYWIVGLNLKGRILRVGLHILVCAAFNGEKPSPKHYAAHWDGNKDNNRAKNVRWATPTQNAADKVRHGRQPRGDKVVTATLKNEEVSLIRLAHRRLKGDRPRAPAGIYRKIAADFGVTARTVKAILVGKNWRHI